MAQPEQGKFLPLGPNMLQASPPQAGGGFTESAHEQAITPANEYALFNIDAERRAALLAAIEVDRHGIARLHNTETSTHTSLVAVRIQNHDATIVPFEKQGEQLLMPLPGHTGSRIGFFIGYGTEGNYPEMDGLLRAGEFPGVPLIDMDADTKPTANRFGVQKPPKQKLAEVSFAIAGIKDNELDQLRWAEQIDLSALGFAEQQRRGIFARVRFPNPTDRDKQLQLQSLNVVPQDMTDLMEHFDASAVTPNLLQIASFDAAWRRETPADTLPIDPHMYRSSDLHLAYGPRYTQTTPDHPDAVRVLYVMQSAFQVRIVPKSK